VESVRQALDLLRDLGSPEEMSRLAEAGAAPPRPCGVNSHVHLPPNFSAFASVEQVVDLAAEQGVRVLGVSNYYDFGVYGDFVDRARRAGIFPLFGTEIIALIRPLVRAGVRVNDPGNPGKIYICGKGITRFEDLSDEARRLLGLIRRNDEARMAEMCRRLEGLFAAAGVQTGLDAPAVVERVVRRHGCPREVVTLQERHLAQAFQEVLFDRVGPEGRAALLARLFGVAPKGDANDPLAVQGQIRTHLMKAGKAAFVEETFLDFEQAYRLILELGGIPCYPTLADGVQPVCEYEQPVEKLIENVRGLNVHCAEFIPIRNRPDVLRRYALAMRRAGLVVLAGTEHNTVDLLPIEPTCVQDLPIGEDLREIFWEGACVVAAHQFLALHGRCGFVDEAGRPNAAFDSDAARIGAFARLGAAVIARYFQGAPKTQEAER